MAASLMSMPSVAVSRGPECPMRRAKTFFGNDMTDEQSEHWKTMVPEAAGLWSTHG